MLVSVLAGVSIYADVTYTHFDIVVFKLGRKRHVLQEVYRHSSKSFTFPFAECECVLPVSCWAAKCGNTHTPWGWKGGKCVCEGGSGGEFASMYIFCSLFLLATLPP